MKLRGIINMQNTPNSYRENEDAVTLGD
jgi:hypothetical protein